jgi:thiamine-monophosphate kinase
MPEKMGELALIARIRQQFAHRPTALIPKGIGDDCAILRPPAGHEILVTTDFTLEDRHFRRDFHPARVVGHRCLTRGLSDLAAMGATPMAAFLSLAVPKGLSGVWVGQFLDGFEALASASRVTLAGGDTAQSPTNHILADIVLLGTAPVGTSLLRSGAKPGDVIYVTGELGAAAAQLRGLFAGRKVRAHHLPQPRLVVGQKLRGKASACLDLSDGLSTDLTHLCEASKVNAEIDLSRLPVHRTATEDDALNGGEDYELLFTAPAACRVATSIAGTPVTAIGRILRARKGAPRIAQIAADGTRREMPPRGWQHLT